MKHMERLERIVEACKWVASKGAGSRDGCKVSTRVKWADWDKKEFSPAMCVLWWSEVKKKDDGYDTFRIPPAEEWISRVAHALDAPEEWVVKFADQCYNAGTHPDKWTFSVTFDGVDGVRLRNPKVEWKKLPTDESEILPEVSAVLESYGAHPPRPLPEYWTKNPPIDMYREKLVSVAYDLFCALDSAGRL